jgi:hypothetical protein
MRRAFLMFALVFFAATLSVSAFAQNTVVGTTTTMAFSPDPVVYPKSTTVTITVKATSGTGVPAGSVSIYSGATNLVTLTLNASGVATAPLPTTGYPAGAYSLKAEYAGSTLFAASNSPVVTLTLQSAVTVSAQAIPNPITAGQTAELQAVLVPNDGGTATGTVTFNVNGSPLSTVTASGGSALLKAPTTGIAPGTYSITAKYNGDALHAAAASAAASVTIKAPGGAACGTGSEAALTGQYAFVLAGYDGTATVPYQTAGSFIANGSGGITGGEEDFNFFTSTLTQTISPLSVYSVGADGRGCITLVTGSGMAQMTHTYRIALAATSGVTVGQIIEFDDANGKGITASGKLHLQTPATFSLSALAQYYAFGVAGWTSDDGAYNHTGAAGAFDLNTTTGAITGLNLDVNEAGATTFGLAGGTGTFSAVDTHGRATVALSAGQFVLHYAVYILNSEFYVISTDINTAGPILSGKMHSSANNFTLANIAGSYAFYGEGAESNFSFPTQGLGTNVLNAGGDYTITGYYYSDGVSQQNTSTGSLTAASNGRLVLTNSAGHIGVITYIYTTPAQLTAGSAGYVLDADSYASFGGIDIQKSETFSNTALAGNYWFGDLSQPVPGIDAGAGAVALSMAGTISGTVDLSATTGLTPDSAFSLGTFAFGSNGISATTTGSDTLVGVATGEDIYVLNENSHANPILHLTVK